MKIKPVNNRILVELDPDVKKRTKNVAVGVIKEVCNLTDTELPYKPEVGDSIEFIADEYSVKGSILGGKAELETTSGIIMTTEKHRLIYISVDDILGVEVR